MITQTIDIENLLRDLSEDLGIVEQAARAADARLEGDYLPSARKAIAISAIAALILRNFPTGNGDLQRQYDQVRVRAARAANTILDIADLTISESPEQDRRKAVVYAPANGHIVAAEKNKAGVDKLRARLRGLGDHATREQLEQIAQETGRAYITVYKNYRKRNERAYGTVRKD